MDRSERAIELRKKGYNCAQSVLCSFADVLDVPEETLFAVCEGFGIGMGNMHSVCGAVAAAAMAAGLKNSTRDMECPNSTGSTLKLSRTIVEEFEKQNRTIICKELKGIETKTVIRDCPDCIKDAVKIAEQVLGL